MTVLGGIAHEGRVHLGADTAETFGYQQFPVSSKLWRHGPMVFGGVGSTREAQIVEHRLQLPERGNADLMRWLVNDFVDAIRTARREAGHEEKLTTGVERGPLLLFGAEGRLFTMDCAFALSEHTEFAMGSGAAEALGSLHTSGQYAIGVQSRLTLALQAACAHNIYCAPPFTYLSTPK